MSLEIVPVRFEPDAGENVETAFSEMKRCRGTDPGRRARNDDGSAVGAHRLTPEPG